MFSLLALSAHGGNYEEVSSLRKELPNEVKRLLFYRLSKRMKCLVETG